MRIETSQRLDERSFDRSLVLWLRILEHKFAGRSRMPEAPPSQCTLSDLS